MKQQFFSILIAFVALTLPAYNQTQDEIKDMWENPATHLDKIKDSISENKTSWEADKQLSDMLQGMAFAINAEIINKYSQDWAHPSPERKAVIEKWGKTLEPYMPQLVEQAFSDPKFETRSSRQAMSILDYAAPTNELATILRKHLQLQEPRKYWATATLLAQHRLLSDQDRDVLREAISLAKNDEERKSIALQLYSFGVLEHHELLLSQALSVFQKDPTEYNGEIDLPKNYQMAFMAVQLGVYSEELKQSLLEWKKKVNPAHIRLIVQIDDALEYIAGSKMPPRPIARNGSGYLPVGNEHFITKTELDQSHYLREKNSQNTMKKSDVEIHGTKKNTTTKWFLWLAISFLTSIFFIILKKIITTKKS